jgi:hypothetical protein
MSATDILRKYGKWIESSKFIILVKNEIEKNGKTKSERQIYREIKKAVKNREILKITVQDRTVLYGLAEFGPPPNLSNIIVFYREKEDLAFINKMSERGLLEDIENIKEMNEFFKEKPKDSIIKVHVINGIPKEKERKSEI